MAAAGKNSTGAAAQHSPGQLRRSQSLHSDTAAAAAAAATATAADAAAVATDARALLEIFLARSWSVNLAEGLSAITEQQQQPVAFRHRLDDVWLLRQPLRPAALSDPVATRRRPASTSAVASASPSEGDEEDEDEEKDLLLDSGDVVDAVDGDPAAAGTDSRRQRRHRGRRRRRRANEQRPTSTGGSGGGGVGGQDAAAGVAIDDDDRVQTQRRPRAHTDSAALCVDAGGFGAGSRFRSHHQPPTEGGRLLLLQQAFNVTPSPSPSDVQQEQRRPTPRRGGGGQLLLQQPLVLPPLSRLRRANIVRDFDRACRQQGEASASAASASSADAEENLDRVAAMLELVARDFSEAQRRGSLAQQPQQQLQHPFCLHSALKAKEDRVLGKKTDGKPPVDEATLDSLLDCLDSDCDGDAFGGRLSHLLLGNMQAWRSVAMLYQVTRLLCQRRPERRDVIKARCLRHFDDHFAQWVLRQGGWQAVVEDTDESELD